MCIIKKLLENNYNILMESIFFLERENIDYEINNTRRVYVINGKYILKEIFNDNKNNLNYLYDYLNFTKSKNYISPIINIKGDFVTAGRENSIYILFNKYVLGKIKKFDFAKVFQSYIIFYETIKHIDIKKINSSYSQDLKYFLYFSKRIDSFWIDKIL